MVQTFVRSNRFLDPVISVWEHRGVRSIRSDHSSIWVWTKTWVIAVNETNNSYLQSENQENDSVRFCHHLLEFAIVPVI